MEFENQLMTARDDVRIAYYDVGNSDGPPLILSNGLGGNILAWRYLVSYFEKTHRIISWDYRGLYHSGRSEEMDGYSIERHVGDLEDLIAHLEVDNPLLLGWSMGVQVNFEYCRHHQGEVAGVVAINGTSGRPFRTLLGKNVLDDSLELLVPHVLGVAQQHWEKVAFVGPMVADSRLVLRGLQALGVIGSTANIEVFQDLAKSFVTLDFGIYTQILEELGVHDAADVVDGLTLPLLMIAGDSDPMTPAAVFQQISEKLPQAEISVIPGATHYCPIEFPELVNLRIEKFIREQVPGHQN